METKQYKTWDKSRWEDGPWKDEPDKVQWQDPITGYPCLVVRAGHGGLCGYVGVPESHPDYGKSCDDVPVEAHGGTNFSDSCQPGPSEAYGICHVPGPGESDKIWWFGFDCAHSSIDLTPKIIRDPWTLECEALMEQAFPNRKYRTLEFVRAEVSHLARQLKCREQIIDR